MDYVRVLYKRRWIAIPAFLIVFVIGTINSFRTTPIYQARAQLLIEKDTPNVGNLSRCSRSSDGWYNDDFYQTQYRILQSRSLARRTVESMNLCEASSASADAVAQISLTGMVWERRVPGSSEQVFGAPQKPASVAAGSAEPADPLAPYVDEVLGSLTDRAGPQQPDRRDSLLVDRSRAGGRHGQRATRRPTSSRTSSSASRPRRTRPTG